MTERILNRPSESLPEQEMVICCFTTMYGSLPGRQGAPGWCRLVADPEAAADADVVIFHIPTASKITIEKRPGQLWVAWSMESDANYRKLRDPQFMRQFDLTMTYRLDSDVPVTYHSYYEPREDFLAALRRPPLGKSPDRLATMFISSNVNQSHRLEYAAELMQRLDVHSYGTKLRNRELSGPDLGRSTKLALIGQSKFDLSFENSISGDYVTEKFFDPFVAGTVPVYLGAPNVETFAPGDRCYINTADFPNPGELAEYLQYLNHDDAAYADYFAWKERPFRGSFLAMLEEHAPSPIARLCEVLRTR